MPKKKNSRISRRGDTSYHVVQQTEDATAQGEDGVDFGGNFGRVNPEDSRKIYMLGEKDSGFKVTGPPQNYEELLKLHLQNKTLFNDESFSPESIALPKLPDNAGPIEWKRPFEISSNPGFIVDGASRFDVDQGNLGDCWFLAAIANVTSNELIFNFVVPPEQSFTKNYAGIFHFRFWQYGRWVDVVIDDRLPTINHELIFLRSTDQNEFWTALLEKAYAKLYGSYKAIDGGQISEALEDMCGGLSEFYLARSPQIFEIMQMSFERSSLMGCSITSTEVEGRRPDGLVTTHAYSVTNITTVKLEDHEEKLIRLRNPWGNYVEWNGLWSDKSDLWNLIAEDVRNKLLVQKEDGEFWMNAKDFQANFTYVDICHLNPTTFSFSEDSIKWNVDRFEGSWISNVTAGGGYQYIDTFANNPQYFISIKSDYSEKVYSVVIGLMQKSRRFFGENELPLELNIFRVKSRAGKLLSKSFFQETKPVIHEQQNGVRQLTVRISLPRGTYCIVPSTIPPNVYASYLLRIYSEVDANAVVSN